ncbi:hypothetical protein [Lactonifactor longoviformis]|uniref:hypothetical protein n=1 Tax=Lactonifactor longoviformis TaxID=341220 RepID=UPI00147636F4|nr:hypothetical protein [Lactonifactor longoviformis]
MVKIICSTKGEKEKISRLIRLGELIVLGVEVILRVDLDCFNHGKIKWEVKEK